MSSPSYQELDETEVEEESPIALSDLVRTGETSRQRRRGPMAVDHSIRRNRTAPVPDPPWFQLGEFIPAAPQPPEPSMADGSSEWADFLLQEPPPLTTAYPPWPGEDPLKFEESNDASDSMYKLYCGYEEWEFDDEEPFEVSPLPEYPPPTPVKSNSMQRRLKRSNGCGALIHVHGTPRTRMGTWQAKGKATSVVIPLDNSFFERGGAMKAFTCGCRYHGVGCAVCGNTLGNVYLPCQAATPPPSNSPRPIGPSTSPAVYTFFCTSTSSFPAFTFPDTSLTEPTSIFPPPPTVQLQPLLSSPSSTSDPSFASMMGMGLGGIGVEGEGVDESFSYLEQEAGAVLFNADGVLISSMDGMDGMMMGLEEAVISEPSSPKVGEGRMLLWPDR